MAALEPVAKPSNAGQGLLATVIRNTDDFANVRPGPDITYVPIRGQILVGSRVTYYPATARQVGPYLWRYIEQGTLQGWCANVVNFDPVTEPIDKPARKLSYGINLNPRHPAGLPRDAEALRGLSWARMVFSVGASQQTLAEAFAFYDPLIAAYNALGVGALLILNQETYWGIAPWDNGNWGAYANDFANLVGQIAAHYRGRQVAYEIWNEGDTRGESSVFVAPPNFAPVLDLVAAAIRRQDSTAPIVFGGLASGTGTAIQYVRDVRAALGGRMPVDAIGVHPYGHWPGDRAPELPTGWFAPLEGALNAYVAAFAPLPVWVTEIGVSEPGHIQPVHYPRVADYIRGVADLMQRKFVRGAPVLVWFGWSDVLREAGITDFSGSPKPQVYSAFFEKVSEQIGEGEEGGKVDEGERQVTPTDLILTPTRNLNVRERPTTESPALTNVPPGTKLIVIEPKATAEPKIGVADQWIHIQLENGTRGYVYGGFTRLAADNILPDEMPLLVRTTLEQLNVRAGPRTDFAILTTISPADLLVAMEAAVTVQQKVKDGAENWLYVRVGDQLGWVLARAMCIEAPQGGIPSRDVPRIWVTDCAVPAERAAGEARAYDLDHLPCFTRVPVSNERDVSRFSGFGPNNFAYANRESGIYRQLCFLHNGLDFGIRIGTLLCAVDWGVVVHVSQNDQDNPYGSGPFTVIVRYGNHLAVYGHLRGAGVGTDMFVGEGQIVAPGDPIAASGTFNNFPHLHFEMRRIDSVYIDTLRRRAISQGAPDIPQMMNRFFLAGGLRAWSPTPDYYINPALFFNPPLESYVQRNNWGLAWEEPSVDRDFNGYPDQFKRPGETTPTQYDLYSIKSIPSIGTNFFTGAPVA